MAERRRRLEGGRRHKYSVRFADAENELMVAAASAASLTVPHLIAETMLLVVTRKDRLSVVDRRMLASLLSHIQRELTSQSVNLNQLARAANIHGQLPEGNARAMREITDVAAQARDLLNSLREIL